MKRIAVILAILALAISVKANYSIYDFTGHVVLIQGGRQIKPEKGMKVMPTDEIEIAPGAKVEIYNEKTKEICKDFHGMPGPKSRLFMGCQATEINHFAKPFKMDLNL